MRTVIFIISLFFLPINSFAVIGEYKGCRYETRDGISVLVSGGVSRDTEGIFSYSYSVRSAPQSKQNVWLLEIMLPEKSIIVDVDSPGWGEPGWSGKSLKGSALLEEKPPYWIGWSAPEGMDIRPTNALSGFSFRTSFGLPGIVDNYTEGYAPIPRCEEELEEDVIPGYDDLTPYGPGVVGKTIGPTAPPADFKPLDFLNSIINMKHGAYKLGWIKNEGILKSLDAKLDNAKKDIEKGNTRSAKNTLKAFINEVEAQGCESYENCPSGKHLTSEAYGLLKYNAQYLVDRL